MMPSAKTENRSSPPPENRLIQPNKVPERCDSRSASACPSIPGVGTATPIRYTANIAAVNSRRRRSSGMREAFANPSSIQFCRILNQFRHSAESIDFFACALRKRMSANCQLERQVAITQDLHLVTRPNQPAISHNCRVDHLTFSKGGKAAQVYMGVLVTPGRIFGEPFETPFRQTPLQRHLPTFVSGRCVTA